MVGCNQGWQNISNELADGRYSARGEMGVIKYGIWLKSTDKEHQYPIDIWYSLGNDNGLFWTNSIGLARAQCIVLREYARYMWGQDVMVTVCEIEDDGTPSGYEEMT